MTADVDHDQFRSSLGGILNKCGGHRMIGWRVGARDQSDIGSLDVGKDIGYGARTNGLHQGGY